MTTNMSIEKCEIPKELDSFVRLQFRERNEPKNQNGISILNPDALDNKYANDFYPIDSGRRWGSRDPKLFSASHEQVLTLDRQPIDGRIPLEKIYTDTSLDNYGKNYRTYSDINAGHITYYIDKSIEDPFFEPLYTNKILSSGELYKDPMGGIKPQYERRILTKNDPINMDRSSYNGCLSWIEDTQEHREDLLSKQMRKYNQQRWEPRWS